MILTMSNFKQNIERILGVLMLTLFVSNFIGITFFPHKHIVSGKLIVHSHPFSSTENHSHSANVLLILQQLSQFTTKTLATGVFILALSKICRILLAFNEVTYPNSTLRHFSFLRPPPVNFTFFEVN
jgi:hypothetical protein